MPSSFRTALGLASSSISHDFGIVIGLGSNLRQKSRIGLLSLVYIGDACRHASFLITPTKISLSMTSTETTTKPPSQRLPNLKLDPSLYNPQQHELEFFKEQTGIEDDEELKAHILAVQKEAWEVSSSDPVQE